VEISSTPKDLWDLVQVKQLAREEVSAAFEKARDQQSYEWKKEIGGQEKEMSHGTEKLGARLEGDLVS